MNNLKLNTKKLISGIFIGSGIVLASNYVNTAKCDIDVPHAHAYESVDGTVFYLPKEKKEATIKLNSYTRKDDYIELKDGDEELLKALARNKLVSYKDNYDLIRKKLEEHAEYCLFEYKYDSFDLKYNGSYHYCSWTTHKKWTDDIEKVFSAQDQYKNLVITGKVKFVRYNFKTFNLVKNKFGFYEVQHGPTIYDIDDISDDYPYMLCINGGIFGFESENIVEGTVDVVDNNLLFSALGEDNYIATK